MSNCAAPKNYAEIISQPKAFTFYEQGNETVEPLVLGAGGSSTMTYKWYKIVGNNINARVSAPCTATDGTGFNTNTFTPTSVKKGTTNDARNTGFYRYYCVAKNATNDSVVSITAEVAVGCGAKDMFGNWISFMCFNLGATPQSIVLQKSTSITLTPTSSDSLAFFRSANERTLYGDLFQWGRIADGHENRNAIQLGSKGNVDADNCVTWDVTTPPTYEDGNIIGSSQTYPWQQVSRSDATYYGKFIKTINDNNNNWYVGTASNSNLLWRENAFAANDPCQHINADGTTYSTFYPPAAPNGNGGSGTGWRIPNQGEWASLYRGGNIAGSPAIASANTWSWYQLNATYTEGVKGLEVKPDGATTTLFLPFAGRRAYGEALLYRIVTYGFYWSASSLATGEAYDLYITNTSVNPSHISLRGMGFALRCIKN